MTSVNRPVLAAAALPTLAFAALALAVRRHAPAPPVLDFDVANWLHSKVVNAPGIAHLLRVIGSITRPWVIRPIAAVIAVGLAATGRRRLAAWLVLTFVLGGVLELALKQGFARNRPVWPDPIVVITGYSFPSGHALTSVLVAGAALVLLDRPARVRAGGLVRATLWLLSLGFVVAVGADRVLLGVHYLTDVLAGWAVGLATVLVTVAVVPPRLRHPAPPDPPGPRPPSERRAPPGPGSPAPSGRGPARGRPDR